MSRRVPGMRRAARTVPVFLLHSAMIALALAAAPGTRAADAPSLRREATAPRSDVQRIDRLLRLVQARLADAPKRAEARWSSMTRIEDADAEEKAITAARSRSARLGLDADVAARFVRAQLDASKSIQAARHRQWTLEPSTAPTRAVQRGASEVAWPASSQGEPPVADAELRALRDAMVVLRKPGARRLLDARAADLIQLGGADLLASQIALEPLYDAAR